MQRPIQILRAFLIEPAEAGIRFDEKNILGAQTTIDRRCLSGAANEKRRRGKQRERQSDLHHDQRMARKESPTAPARVLAGVLFQISQHTRARKFKRGTERKSQRAKHAETERRSQDRLFCVDPSSLSVFASLGRDLRPAPIRNISTGGIGMLLDRRVDPGTLLSVELLNKAHQFWHLKLLRVIHATLQDDESWLVGSSFLKGFTDAEFQALLEAPQQ